MPGASLTDTQGIIALAAIGVALVALLSCAALARSLRRVRSAQRLVLGGGAKRDIVAHGAELQEAFEALQEYVGDVAARLEDRLDAAETAVAGAISNVAMVRYDAYNEMSGHQSLSIALLDSNRSGIVLSSIHHRDQARLYAKQVIAGTPELKLSPEEEEALRLALAE